MKNELDKTICDLWNVSRIALAGGNISRWDRMCYVKYELKRSYPHLIEGMSNKSVWFAIEDQIN